MSAEQVEDFFARYRADFERFDADAVAGHFAFPLHVTGDADPVDVRSVASKEEWLETLTMLLDLYRGFGVTSAVVLDSTTTSLSERIHQATMHWSLRDGSDVEIYDFHGIYTLIERDGHLRITAIAHDELGKILAKLG
jgi:hypothetical protein